MINPAPPRIVHIVDDDLSILRAISRLLRSHEYESRTYASAAEFLRADSPSGAACLVLDLQMPGVGGLAMQEMLATRKDTLPIIFVSGHGNIPASVQAMKAGAVDFLTKPFDDDQLMAAIGAALLRSQAAHLERDSFDRDRKAFHKLSERERQVCLYLAQGYLNKQIAAEFGTREQTVKAQRGNLMRKLAANSSADIVRLIERLRSAGYFIETSAKHDVSAGLGASHQASR